jgi:hypothetical protein
VGRKSSGAWDVGQLGVDVVKREVQPFDLLDEGVEARSKCPKAFAVW